MRKRYKVISWHSERRCGLVTDGTKWEGKEILFTALQEDLDPTLDGKLLPGEIISADELGTGFSTQLKDILVESGPRAVTERLISNPPPCGDFNPNPPDSESKVEILRGADQAAIGISETGLISFTEAVRKIYRLERRIDELETEVRLLTQKNSSLPPAGPYY
jgi:hypothetical protein